MCEVAHPPESTALHVLSSVRCVDLSDNPVCFYCDLLFEEAACSQSPVISSSAGWSFKQIYVISSVKEA